MIMFTVALLLFNKNLYVEKGICASPFLFPGRTDYKITGRAWCHLFYDCLRLYFIASYQHNTYFLKFPKI